MIKKRLLSMILAVTMCGSLFTGTIASAAATTLTVDKSALADGTTTFNTIHEAVAKAKEINPQSEDARVTINVNPGNYEEQVVFDGVNYVTLQQAPDTKGTGKVNLNWYYCTGYAAANCDLTGNYNPDIDWYANPPKDSSGKEYKLGEAIAAGTTLTYTDVNGESHTQTVSSAQELGNTGGMDKMATLIVKKGATNITVKDLNIVNSVPVMVTQGQKDAHLTPLSSYPNLPDRAVDALTICDEDTTEVRPSAFSGEVTLAAYNAEVAKGTKFSAGESAFLAKSGLFNERGHAVATYGDKIIFDGIRLRGGQDSLYAAGNRAYFNECDIIGGTDYIYGGASAVFNNCTLGLEGFSDKSYGSPIATPNTDALRKYGYLFYNCTLYNVRENNGTNNFGGPWGAAGQVTYFNTTIDDSGTVGKSAFKLDEKGWARFNAENGHARLYEYGTRNNSGAAVDLSKRIVNKSVEDGGYGMGTVLDKWQILEFNPRNYFAAECDTKNYADDWDPMNFGETYLTQVDTEIAAATIDIPAGEETVIALPTPADSNIEFHWVSASTNAVVSSDEQTLTVVRPALGEEPIATSVILYARDKNTGFGDKKEIPVTIAATTDTENVFSIPVTVSASASTNTDSDYVITVSKNGALIKSQTVTVKAGETTASDTIENIPASAEGIDYDVKVVSSSDDFTISSPENGVTTVTGKTGESIPLTITAEKAVDETVSTNIFYSNTDGNKVYDLIALAQANGADDDILTSDIITVTYTLDVTPETSGSGYIDLLAGTPDSSVKTSGVPSRFLLGLLRHWNQLDLIDSGASGYSGTSDTANQWLNSCGKFVKGTPSTLTVTINYKEQTITAVGSGSGSSQSSTTKTFEAFPTQYEKGKLNMAVYPGNEIFDMRNVWVSYKRVLGEGETVLPTPVPSTPKPEPTSEPGTEYGTVTENADGSITLNFGEQSITTSNGGKMSADSANGGVLRPDSVRSTANDIAVFTLPSVDLAGKYAKAEIYMSKETGTGNNPNPVNVSLKVGGVEVASFTNMGTGSWNTFQAYTEDLINNTASGNVTMEITGAGAGSYVGNFVYVKFIPGSIQETTAPATATPAQATPTPVPATPKPTAVPAGDAVEVDFTAMSSVPVYTAESGRGFVSTSGAIMAEGYDRQVASTDTITVSAAGASVTESTGDYLANGTYKNSSSYTNYGGLIYRLDTAPGAYRLEVTLGGSSTSSNTRVAPTGLDYSRLTGTGAWDTAGHVAKYAPAVWNGKTWTYDFATGESFVEIDIEPNTLPTSSAPQTVTVESIKITPIAVGEAGDKPTIHILGDSTQKTYTFNETISSWGQTLYNYFDLDKVNVVNYSMGGRCMRNNYCEGRFNDVLIRGNAGDFVFIHSAHNDESAAESRFDRGTNYTGGTAAQNNALYNRWLDMYVEAIKARGMTPVLVSPMTRGGGKAYTFNPDSPGNMRAKAASDPEVGYIELYQGSIDYYAKLEANEGTWTYNNIEAGETPANNSANGASGDGTHYREAAAKQFCRIMLQSVYDQANASTDTYNDKAIVEELVSYMPESVQNAAKTKDWSAVFPEMASDVSAVDVVPGAVKQTSDNYYYRTAIEKVLQLGALHKDEENNFKPTEAITVGEFARGIETVFGLPENSLTSYTKTYAELSGTEPTATPTSAPTDTPTPTDASTATPVPTDVPDTSARIVSAVVDDGNTVVTLANIADGVLIGAAFDGNSVLTAVKFKDITGDDMTLEGIEADEVYVWDSIQGMNPICNAKAVGDTLSISETVTFASGDIELLNADLTVTVNQTEGGTITVYNNSAFESGTGDVGANVTAGSTFVDNEYMTMTAPENLVAGSDKSGVFNDNKDISTNYFEFRNSNPEKIVTYLSKADGIITVYARFNDNKSIELSGDGQTQAQTLPGEGTGATVYGTVQFNVKAGVEYQLWARGGTGRLFGVKYESNDYPQSTTSLSANEGDEIRVVASPDSGYLNDSILVNGEAVASGKEYTFTVSGNTTVSATYRTESDFVETTVIASDAALTREAMGAILYDAYLAAYGKNADGSWNKVAYMNQNGSVPSPDDPNYDPNIKYEGSPYIPLVGWAALSDISDIDNALYGKVKEVYNLGLMRSEKDNVRGQIKVGDELEPTAVVTRAKAAKTLAFCYVLTQNPNEESQIIPDNHNYAAELVAPIVTPNPDAPSTPFTAN